MRKVTIMHKVRRKLRNRDSGFHPQNKAYKWFVLGNIMLGTFMAVLDSTVVNVGLPKIMASFGVGLDKIEWVITAYMLAMAVMLPTSGWIADKFGFKRIYFMGLLFFTLGSLLCGLSNDENTLIISRIIQGLGAGTIQPLGMAIITREFPVKQRGVALGFWAIAAAASVSFGPLIGGYLVDNFSWQLIFYINIPVGIIALLFTIIIQKEYINKRIKDFDYIGFLSVVIFLPVMLFALSEGNAATNSDGWSAPYILICFSVSILALAVFITHELTTKHPLLDLRLLTNYNFGFCNLILFIFSMGMFGSTFLLPLFLQNSLGYTAMQAGIVFLPVGIIQGTMSPVSGFLASKINPKFPMLLGITLLGFSFYLNSKLSFLSEHNFIMTSLYIRGFAMGITFTPLSTLSLINIPKEKMAQASAISNTIRQIAGSIGVALFTTLLVSRVSFHNQIFGNAVQTGSEEFKNVIANMAYQFQSHGGSTMAAGIKQGQGFLISHISKQAYIQGIDDDFLLAGLITILALIPTIILRTRKKTEQLHNA
jgi:MFS transporter, DHA2 family, multidrug resistance protein